MYSIYRSIILLSTLLYAGAYGATMEDMTGHALPEKSRDAESRKPNFIIIFTDDHGYADVGCFGSNLIRTPQLDQMAREGMRFTNFYAQTVCGPSRASLMTGCYPLRVARWHNISDEVMPRLDLREVTVAEVLKDEGYATGMFGKWHLAGPRQDDYLTDLMPIHQGFDYYFGTARSGDVAPVRKPNHLQLMRGDKVIETDTDISLLTQRYTDEAIGFIRNNHFPKEHPFFIYLAFNMPHVPLAASKPFRGKSPRGLYGDVVEEIDWNVGRLLDALKELKLDQDTYVIFTSDNGPWLNGGGWGPEYGGSADPLRGNKASNWDGGMRVPCIMWAPGHIPAGRTCDEIATTMDILPTFARLSGGQAPTDRVIDGHDISTLMRGDPGAKSPTKAFYYYTHTFLEAVRSGRWKLHLPRPAIVPWMPNPLYWKAQFKPEDDIEIKAPMLFDLESDIGESLDVAKEHPDVVSQLLKLAEWAREDIGDYNRVGQNARFFDTHHPHRPDVAKWQVKR